MQSPLSRPITMDIPVHHFVKLTEIKMNENVC